MAVVEAVDMVIANPMTDIVMVVVPMDFQMATRRRTVVVAVEAVTETVEQITLDLIDLTQKFHLILTIKVNNNNI